MSAQTDCDDDVFRQHDHKTCVDRVLVIAEQHCRRDGLRLTPVRKRVLEILLERHRAVGAYDLLNRLREEGLGSQPPVIYRALDFLAENGFVHKIHKLNAFVACAQPSSGHSPVFMICRCCNKVQERTSSRRKNQLSKAATEVGFVIEQTVVEAEGLCPECQGVENS